MTQVMASMNEFERNVSAIYLTGFRENILEEEDDVS